MLETDRALYIRQNPYEDSPQPIPNSRATISAPHMHALSLCELLPEPGASVLDVGCGTGYLVSCFARLVGVQGIVVGIDHIPTLTDLARSNIASDLGVRETGGKIEIVTGDGRLGYPAAAPYDAIHVGAAAPRVPDALIDQLKMPGKMYIPLGEAGGDQHMWVVTKDRTGKITKKKTIGVRYVPLTDA